MQDKIVIAAEMLLHAAKNKIPCSPVRNVIGHDLDAAYAVQKMNTMIMQREGHRVVGHKIGATSKSVQAQFKINEPDFGLLFEAGRLVNGSVLDFQEIMQPKIEGEIAIVLKKDIEIELLNPSDLFNSISHVTVAIELLGSRISNWDIELSDTIADNASASHWVLGDTLVSIESVDLINCKMTMKRNNLIVSQGFGSDTLGSPLNSLLWLSRTLIRLGHPMRAGDIVLTGALGPVVDAKRGDTFSVDIEGLGSTSVQLI